MRTLDPGVPVYDHVIVCGDLRAHDSPPFGAVTVTDFTPGAVVVVVVGATVVDVVVDVVVDDDRAAPEFGSTINEDSSMGSKSEPCSAVRPCRSLSFQRPSG